MQGDNFHLLLQGLSQLGDLKFSTLLFLSLCFVWGGGGAHWSAKDKVCQPCNCFIEKKNIHRKTPALSHFLNDVSG